jgi:hypothetical protein
MSAATWTDALASGDLAQYLGVESRQGRPLRGSPDAQISLGQLDDLGSLDDLQLHRPESRVIW